MTTNFVISINCDHAAYHGGELEDSLVENLQEIGTQLMLGNKEGVVRDYNGNTVGKYFFTKS
jgi:hypothetical protein